MMAIPKSVHSFSTCFWLNLNILQEIKFIAQKHTFLRSSRTYPNTAYIRCHCYTLLMLMFLLIVYVELSEIMCVFLSVCIFFSRFCSISNTHSISHNKGIEYTNTHFKRDFTRNRFHFNGIEMCIEAIIFPSILLVQWPKNLHAFPISLTHTNIWVRTRISFDVK